ncbi:MAG TPA: AraC family transcriptional regulator ligand-binding domain-containing protein [Actinophytocola sp.]|jgi:AraC-like DNA-binding protein|uniref:AraC family transcriptional regulator n=1 Tax=Actinophytocola sp. TaxID=1872138 RepID=UPI002E0ADD3E|nr:AraC family transcriptional regulator ligand-binding domain-containing protein [Actinophytocola sp.]
MDRSRHGAASHTVVTVHQVFQEAIRAGIGRTELRVLTGLDPDDLTDFSRRVPVERLFSVWETVMRRLDDPGFPVRAARNAIQDARSAVYYLAASCRDIREGIASSVANVSAWTTAYTITATPWRGGMSLVLDGLDPGRLGARCEAEFQLADILSSIRSAIPDFAPGRVAFTHPAPRDTRTHREYFGPGLEFRAAHTEITLPDAVLDLPVPTAQAGLAGVLAGHVAGLRAAHDIPASYGLRVREWLLSRFLTGEQPTAAAAAKALTLSERTLHRRLAAEGATFRGVRESTRRQLAVDLVRDSPRPFKEIASNLGFADTRSFHRAYLRWTGTTPGSDRRT